jgi:hypothetical protein
VDYGEWDMDADDALGIEEFRSWWNEQDFFDDWRADEDEGITREQFAERLHVEWDTNGDDVVSEVEWQEGTDTWFAGDVEDGAWDDWDGDGDSELDANEVAEGLERNGLYDRVDRDDDAVIDDEELADWFFDIFDDNDDDRIDTTEWDAAKSNVVEG